MAVSAVVVKDVALKENLQAAGEHIRNGEFFLAEKAVLSALQLDPKSSTAWGFLGDINMKRGNYDEAGGNYFKAIKLDAKNINAHIGQGKTHLRMCEYNEALKCFKQAEGILPGERECWLSLADAYLMLGKTEDAIAAIKKAGADPSVALDQRYSLLTINGQQIPAFPLA